MEKRLCKDAKVKSYPTMFFFRGGERIEYDGLRGVGDLTSFAKKAVDVGTGVSDVTAEAFEKLEETEEVIFVYFYDHATTSEDFDALERLTLSLVGHAKLVKSNDPALYKRFKISTWPRLMVSRSSKPSYYSPLAPKDMRDTRKVLTWMKHVWQPIVPELTSQNAHEVMDGKLVVLGILSSTRQSEYTMAKKELKNAALEWMDREAHAVQLERQELRDAKQLRIEEAEDRNDNQALRKAKAIRIKMDEVERRDVRFMWVDGLFWERWIRTTFGVDVRTDGERVVIYDEGVSLSSPSLPSSDKTRMLIPRINSHAATGTPPPPETPSSPPEPPSSKPSPKSSNPPRNSHPNQHTATSSGSSGRLETHGHGTRGCLPLHLPSYRLLLWCWAGKLDEEVRWVDRRCGWRRRGMLLGESWGIRITGRRVIEGGECDCKSRLCGEAWKWRSWCACGYHV
jgi:hypothetical protein